VIAPPGAGLSPIATLRVPALSAALPEADENCATGVAGGGSSSSFTRTEAELVECTV